MPININQIMYLTSPEFQEELNLSRQTLWRWRQEGKIPPGHRYRRHQVIFTPEEAQAIRDYANQVEPIDPEARDQLSLFDSRARKGERR